MNKTLVRATIAASIAMLASCGSISDNTATSAASSNLLVTDITVSSCNTADAQNAEANAMVATANAQMQDDLKRMGQAMNDGSWDSVKAAAPVNSTQQYDAILAKYPGHCGAQFGKAMVTMANLVRNPDIDAAMKDLQAENGATSTSYTAYLTTSEEQVPAALFKVAQATHASRSTNVASLQNTIGTSVLAVTDSAIAYFENILKDPSFAFEFQYKRSNNTTKTIQIDNGDIGPALAMLKYIKSLEIVFASVQVDPSMNGTLDFIDTLTNIQDADFDNLRPGQTAALDHALSLADKNSPFLTIKSEWRNRYAQIPSLLKSAIRDVQTGLAYSINETTATQVNDLYKVGNGAGADVTPAELQQVSDNLERVVKYLDGSVTIPYAQGTKTITVNIPKFFTITDGYQDFLPYHTVRPYTEWNDVISSDTSWSSYLYFDLYEISGKSLATALGQNVVHSTAVDYEYLDGTNSYGYLFANGDTVIMSNSYSSRSTTCTVSYSYHAKVNTIIVPACKATAAGASFASYANTVRKVPFIFTDASGKATFLDDMSADMDNIINIEGIEGFKNKIIFPDPTFGGVFPGLTNDNIWATIHSLDLIKARRACDANGLDYWGDCSGSKILPTNPSDLDVLTYYFN